MTTVPGIDVSAWQAKIDWPTLRATGQEFVFVKATEGNTYYDDKIFYDDWAGAKSVGLLRGAYHFYRCKVDAKKQADYFINYIKKVKDNGELPPVLDLEVSDGVTKDNIIKGVKIWLDLVEAEFGKKPIIYSNPSFLQANLSVAWAKNYPLWLAWYPNQYTDGMKPALPNGWNNWVIWQYSQKGRLNGVNGNVDLDVFNGSLDDLYKFAGKINPDPKTKHTIVAGDSFESIANKYGVTLTELVGANPQLLKIGDSLTVPVK